MTNVKPLDASVLYRRTDPNLFSFQTTDDLQDLEEIIGQPRAVEAVRFGIGIRQDGYNIYALGPSGLGKLSLIQRFFERRAANEPVPSDWVYVYNFTQRNKPDAIELPPGKGEEFQKDMQKLVEELRSALTTAFESDEYRSRRQVIEQDVQERQEKALEQLQQLAQEKGFTLLRTPGGIVFAPVKDGEVITPENFQQLPEEERKQIETTMEELQSELQKMLQMVPGIQREVKEKMRELNRNFINVAVGGLVNELKSKYGGVQKIVDYLHQVEEDVIENATDFLPSEEESGNAAQNPLAVLLSRAQGGQPVSLQRYKVNLLVDHSKSQGAPVIYEDNPTYQNLIGDVEHIAQMGALMTDFTLIKPGALHRANGGFLILDARKMLQQPYAWEALKRALRSHYIKIESIGQMLSLITTVTLEPEPIPLKVKVALVGDRDLYYLLSSLDPEFDQLFRVQADFDEQIDRDNENQELYARLIATLAHKDKLHPLDRGAVARVIEQSSRMVEDTAKVSMHTSSVEEILQEADYWTGERGGDVVTADDVQKAIEARIYRSDRLKEREEEMIMRNIWLIDTSGEKIGQVNGLSVISLGRFMFGRPSRITASVWMGKGDVIDIEREVDLSGPIHSKGVLILSGFLGARFAREKPLALSASLAFEQSYSGVEGDSASSAELYALLSAIAETPIQQSFAVTGAVNQHGQVQAIGGVNEKIEGFFDICQSRGLTGNQGVLIPYANITHLMLRHDVVEAVKNGQFRIFPISSIDEGIEILTGIPAGDPDKDGIYPPGTVNGRVQVKLASLAEKQAELRATGHEDHRVTEAEAQKEK